MATKTSQRAVYAVTALIVASMIGGFALADMSLGSAPNTSYQGSHTTNVLQIPGLTWLYTNVTVVPTHGWGSSPVGCTPLQNACNLATGGYTVCEGGFTGSTKCAASDFVEQVNISVAPGAILPATVALTLYITGTPNTPGATQETVNGTAAYFFDTTGAQSTSESILLDFDIGTTNTGPGAVVTVSVLGTT